MIPKELERRKLEFLGQGKRAKVYTFVERKKRYAVKIEKEDSDAQERVKNEVKFLKVLNKFDIGPVLIEAGENYFMYEFVEGLSIFEFLKKRKNPYPVLIKILEQCRILDELKINKLEMHRPLKHIYVKKNKPRMIDFERCYYTKKPKNVTQFCQFLLNAKLVKGDKKEFIEIVKNYKKDSSEEGFKKIIRYVNKMRGRLLF